MCRSEMRLLAHNLLENRDIIMSELKPMTQKNDFETILSLLSPRTRHLYSMCMSYESGENRHQVQG